MNIDYLRWGLAGCGIVLVAGIYLRERFRNKPAGNRKRGIQAYFDSRIDGFSLQARTDDSELDTDLPSMRNQPFNPRFDFDPAAKFESKTESSKAKDREFSESDDPFGIVQIKLTAHDGMCFSGTLLINALSSIGLEYGTMSIFHKQLHNSQLPLFSVVNMVEPGTFPVDDPSHFESPGVVFFLQVSVSDQPLFAFDEMLQTVQILAARIGGEIRDAENDLLTVDKTAAIRESLVPVSG